MNTIIKKIIRIGTYGALVSIVGLFGFLFSRKPGEHHITMNPSSLLGDTPSAHADIPGDSGDSGDSGSGDSGSGSGDGDM